MPPFDPFSHYLAYGATDQETFRALRGTYNGILVPGTIAAWQRQGTGGFVLSISATAEAPPYMIDPRFPLFQQGLEKPKQSHQALAALLGDEELVRTSDPTPDAYPASRLADIAANWVKFNREYGITSNRSFDKYMRRLEGEEIVAGQAQGPEAILAPYFACAGVSDPWWSKSVQLFEFAQAESDGETVLRVVCASHSGALAELLSGLDASERLVLWVSGLDEHNASERDLVQYRSAISTATAVGHEPFALYGGFFSVLLGVEGLRGQAHGVGFSEHRQWRELPESGAPPARYYLRRAHRYVGQDLAQALYEHSAALTECPCEHCAGRPPIQLDYHALMKHSVWCRDEEIGEWYGRDISTSADHLDSEHESLTTALRSGSLPPGVRGRAIGSIEHLSEWAKALRSEA
jgi:hypothetical protein